MEDDFLTDNLLIHIEGEIADKYNYEDIMKEFKDAKRQRVELYCLLSKNVAICHFVIYIIYIYSLLIPLEYVF
jgi:hypothetical protein